MSAPIVVLLYERTFVARSFRRALTESWPLYLGLALGWLLLFVLNASAPRSDTAGFHLELSAPSWWMTQAKVLVMYLKLVFWPWPLSVHYQIPYFDSLATAWPWVLLAAIIVAATLLLVWRRTAAGFAAASALLVLAPTLIVPITTEVAAERRMYLPLAAIVALVGAGTVWLVSSARNRTARSADRQRTPRSQRRCRWRCAALANGRKLRHFGCGTGCGDGSARGVVSRSRLVWQEAVDHQPANSTVLMNLGVSLVEAGRADEAIEYYREVLRLEPERAATHENNLAYALLRAGRQPEAIAAYEAALAHDPHLAEAHNNLGTILLNSGQPQEAIPHFVETVKQRPDYALGYIGLGIAQAAASQPEAALESFREAVQLAPASIDAWAQTDQNTRRAWPNQRSDRRRRARNRHRSGEQ